MKHSKTNQNKAISISLVYSLFILFVVVLLTACSSNVKKVMYFEGRDDSLQTIDDINKSFVLSEEKFYEVNSDIFKKSKNITISMWIKLESNFMWTTLFSLGNDESHFMQLATSGNPDNESTGITLSIDNGQGVQRFNSSKKETIQVGKYEHIVVSVNNRTLKIFLNGKLISEGRLKYDIRDLNNNIMLIGRSVIFEDPTAIGEFRKFAIYNYALEHDEIMHLYEDDLPSSIFDSIYFTNCDDVVSDLVLPKFNDINLRWESSHPNLVDNAGKLLSTDVSENTDIKLQATMSINNQAFIHDYVFKILANNDETKVKRTIQYLKNEIGFIINDRDELLTYLDKYEATVEWYVNNENVSIVDNRILKTQEEDKLEIELIATIKSGNYSETEVFKVILMDKYVAYVMSYFNGEHEQENARLAYSYDGLNWIALKNTENVLTTEVGSKRVRDPFIGRDKNGDFIILATHGWDNPDIYIWKSKDLVIFDQLSNLKVSVYDPFLNITGNRAWAPEFYYDKDQDNYVVYFSDPNGENAHEGHIYYVLTKNFENVSYVSSLINTEYPIIDGTLTTLDGEIWLFYKDEHSKSVFMAKTTTLLKSGWELYDKEFIFKLRNVEGPFIVKNDNVSYLYIDMYKQQKFYVACFTNLGVDNDLTWFDQTLYQLPENDVRHGSSISITQKELDIIKNYYGE